MENLERRLQVLQDEIIKTTEFIKNHNITNVKCKACMECKFAKTCLDKENK